MTARNQPQWENVRFRALMLSPSLDCILQLDSFAPGSVQTITAETRVPGGKGLNVARMLAQCGSQVGLSGLIGHDQASRFIDACRAASIDDQLHAIDASTRRNLTLVNGKQELKVNRPAFAGFALTDDLQQALLNELSASDVAILTGSLPVEAPPSLYRELIAALQTRGTLCVLDASGAALAAGVQAAPVVIKPNLAEAAELLGYPLDSEATIAKGARQLARVHEVVILSAGAAGAWFASKGKLFHAEAPAATLQDTTGAGDVMLGQFCHDYFGHDRELTPGLMARTVAAGTAATEQPGALPPAPSRITTLSSTVKITGE
jgi:1-phosphofructokinase